MLKYLMILIPKNLKLIDYVVHYITTMMLILNYLNILILVLLIKTFICFINHQQLTQLILMIM